MDIQLGSISNLLYAAEGLNLMTAVETHYYGPNLLADLGEILRVVAPNGTLILTAETYRGWRMDLLSQPAMQLLNATCLTSEEYHHVLSRVGFVGRRTSCGANTRMDLRVAKKAVCRNSVNRNFACTSHGVQRARRSRPRGQMFDQLVWWGSALKGAREATALAAAIAA
jgi:hypothetical protein